MSQCIFCKIVAGQIPAKIEYSDEFCVAFKDISPKAPVHFLVVPKKHIPTISDINEGEEILMGHLIKVAKDLAKKHSCEGYRLTFNVHEKGGQEVFHVHLHLMGWD